MSDHDETQDEPRGTEPLPADAIELERADDEDDVELHGHSGFNRPS